MRRLWIYILLACAILAGALAGVRWMQTEPPKLAQRAILPVPNISQDGVSISVPGYILTSELAAYRDELFAYLMFNYLRHRPEFSRMRLLLTFDPAEHGQPYRLILAGQGDLAQAIAAVAGARPAWQMTPASKVAGFQRQTELFDSAYNLPVRKKVEQLPRNALSRYLRRFIRFKSATDPRIRLGLEPAPKPLSSEEADRLAGDIITVAEFYSLPLDFFLGIGAMENNYMNVRGDLKHSIWKRRAAPDDVVLERKNGRVRVLNDSAGVWQITRETLRYAHRLIQKDKRDYTLLPEHLRPPAELNVNEIDPHVLTTYAGILLRDLLDHFGGDVKLAVAAYNGGRGNPNLKYSEGVGRAAEHARTVLEQAAALNGESVVDTVWLRSP